MVLAREELGMVRSSVAQFDGTVSAPGEARRFATSTLRPDASAAQLGDIAMIVSELVTNAVRAGAQSIEVSITLDNGEVRIEVTDTVAGWPTLREASADDATGRGLPLVAAIAQSWGVDPNDPTGKHVWATLQLAHAS
jgi:anti-sigma regulatory factor (Ser/Thr protein kinase)